MVLHHLSPVDRISDLPWAILDNILGRLPIKDAVRTSILSTQWKEKWVNLSKLVFDDSCLSDWRNVDYLVNIIYHVMLSHRGPIHTFKLSTGIQPEFSDFDSWIHFLSRNGIKDFTLEYGYGANEATHKMPSCLFSCQQLTHLHIMNSLLEPPSSFQGFSNLVHLHLKGYANNTDALASLIRKCPVLKRLVLMEFENLSHFSIRALKLEYLNLQGKLGLPIVLENCPALAEISFLGNSEFKYDEYQEQERKCHLVEDLSRLNSLKSLQISNWFLTYLNWWDKSRDIFRLSFRSSSHFTVLKLNDIYVGDLNYVIVLLVLFSNLQELYISVEDNGYSEDAFEYLQELIHTSCSFNQLQSVEIQLKVDADGEYKLELEFIKFVLACSPVLEKMTIVVKDNMIQSQRTFMRKLLSFERASTEVRIVFITPPPVAVSN